MRIDFNYVSTHVMKYDDGAISIYYALPQASRLYVVWNGSTGRPVYVGTGANIQDRFDPRVKAVRDLGFSAGQIEPIFIMVVQITIDGVSAPPGDTGRSRVGTGPEVDVEQLLIRTYTHIRQVSVRNIAKTSAFTNNTGGQLEWRLLNGAGINNFGPGGPYYLDDGEWF